ncbi:MAG: elongation factor G [Ignavibacteria bacterium]|nr:elongation factor G [Ignavibacteria bacterium]
MGNINPEKIRNVVIAGHGGSGKTILAESILFTTGATNRFGKIADGSTTSDYNKDEISRGISINSSVLSTAWEDYKLNIIDTPGYTDFTGSVKSAMRIMDTALIVVNAAEGVEVGTEIAVNYSKEYGIESCFIVNKLDSEKANFDNCLSQLREAYGSHVAEIQFPVNEGAGFDTIVDVLKMKLIKFALDGKGSYTEYDIPVDQIEKATQLHQELIEIVAEEDEEMMSRFFDEGGTLTEAELIEGLSREIKAKKILPVLCAAGETSVGTKPLIEFLCKYCPSPLDAAPFMAKKSGTDDYVEVPPIQGGEPTIFVFKTLSEPHVGEMSFFRVLAGKVNAGMDLTNQNKNKVERLTQIFQMNGKNRKDMAEAVIGDIGAVVKLKDTHVNNTLTGKGLAVTIDPIVFPDSLIEQALTSKSKGDEDKISSGLSHLHEEDPTFLFHFDPELGQTIISGQGELHLAIIIARLKEKYGVEVNIVQPRIPFRETIKGKVESVEYKHKKQSGGHGQFGHVFLRLEPRKRGTGFEFANEVVGGAIPTKFIPAVEKGVTEALIKGPLAHYPVVDVKVTVHYGSYHDVDSSEMAFKIAGAQAFKKGFLDSKPVLLEPIYEIEVTVPETFMGDVMGDISSRRGKIAGMDSNGKMQIIKASVPLSELHDYATKLRSITQGRGIFKRKFSHYEEVPKEVETKIVAESQKEQVEA